MQNKLRRKIKSKLVGVEEGQNQKMGALVRLDLRFKTSQALRRGFPIKDLLILQRSTRVRCLLLSPTERKGVRSYVEKRFCEKCDKRHDGKCLVCMGKCYGCGKSGHLKRDCLMIKS